MSSKFLTTATGAPVSDNQNSVTAGALQQTAASLEEISRMVSANSENAVVLERAAQASDSSSRSSQAAVQKMAEAIREISRSNDEVVQEIHVSNREIENIINIISDIGAKTKAINDIVFQTKLISLNASVEVARAGEAGKGFSVVAEEVGNLVQPSGTSAQEISKAMRELDQYANRNAGASQETSDSAKKMREQSETLQQLLNNVTHTVQGSQKQAA